MVPLAVSSQRPLRGDEEVESVLAALGDQFPFGVYHHAFEIRRLDDVQVLGPTGAERTAGANPFVDRNGIDCGANLIMSDFLEENG